MVRPDETQWVKCVSNHVSRPTRLIASNKYTFLKGVCPGTWDWSCHYQEDSGAVGEIV